LQMELLSVLWSLLWCSWLRALSLDWGRG
jgi:hypothetical protein